MWWFSHSLSYHCKNREEIQKVAEEERNVIVKFAKKLRENNIEFPIVAIGSTPACSVGTSWEVLWHLFILVFIFFFCRASPKFTQEITYFTIGFKHRLDLVLWRMLQSVCSLLWYSNTYNSQIIFLLRLDITHLEDELLLMLELWHSARWVSGITTFIFFRWSSINIVSITYSQRVLTF